MINVKNIPIQNLINAHTLEINIPGRRGEDPSNFLLSFERTKRSFRVIKLELLCSQMYFMEMEILLRPSCRRRGVRRCGYTLHRKRRSTRGNERGSFNSTCRSKLSVGSHVKNVRTLKSRHNAISRLYFSTRIAEALYCCSSIGPPIRKIELPE